MLSNIAPLPSLKGKPEGFGNPKQASLSGLPEQAE